ncbi:serine/threonine-protein kinase [Tengunoibacter tsumagoiensis]|uniref:non-specific serine/threonine protein kinase n=1 Tax=Tengunoibacter tsumagoiensis TaxID=2014871 RepID=A0A401ZWW5_9CHLR|nr:serine/threonine-protein kinase [Tengunoibacter tsumagoiensis]GCE11302.1 hypothetical protein KTT_11610 [Tengunoibacter tsumagoiensis]
MKCPYCGTVNPAGENFCIDCGGSLDPTTMAVQGAPSQSELHEPVTSGTGNTTTSTLVPSSRLQGGRYVVKKILGQGGMGAAVLAQDTRIANKEVVIKELISDKDDPEQRQEDVRNFKREVDTLAHLDHPLIPTVTDLFEESGRYYMVQEYAAGQNLEDYLEKNKKPMSEPEALTYASQVLDILDYLSRQHPPIVHRDIKPANIIVSSRDRRARLVDFGIARADALDTKRKQTTALGTPGYAPPEQYQGRADARSDLYALAATLHHILTNRDPADYPPFNYPPARTLNSAISPETERLLERALQMEISKRYQNAAAMKHDVDEILQQRFGAKENDSTYLLSGGLTGKRPMPRPSGASQPGSPASPYEQGYRPEPLPRAQQPGRQWAEPDPSGWRDGGQGQRQRQREWESRQRQMYAPPPPQYEQRPVGNSGNYMQTSFLLLVIVLAIIGFILYVLPYFG